MDCFQLKYINCELLYFPNISLVFLVHAEKCCQNRVFRVQLIESKASRINQQTLHTLYFYYLYQALNELFQNLVKHLYPYQESSPFLNHFRADMHRDTPGTQ